MPAAFEVEELSIRLGARQALERVDLRVDAGEAVALVGPSGAGKTSLLRALIGALRPDTGTVTALGRRLEDLSRTDLSKLRSRVGFVHQNLGLVPNLRVSQNVIAGRLGQWSLLGALRPMLWPSEPMLVEVHDLLERVGIGDKLFQRCDQLSGGEQQRVALARALYQQPQVLLADEPVSSVDPARARDTLELLTRVSREAGLTLCVSLHSLDLARALFPRLVGLRDGRVLFDRASAEVGEVEFEELYRLHSPVTTARGAPAHDT